MGLGPALWPLECSMGRVWQLEVLGSWPLVPHSLPVHRKFKATLGYMRLCPKTQNKTKQTKNRAGDVAQLAECLPSIHAASGLVLSISYTRVGNPYL